MISNEQTELSADVITSTSISDDEYSLKTFSNGVSTFCSNCNSDSVYFAHLENCVHSFCGPCFIAWRRQALFNFVIICSTCGTPSRRAFPWPTVNSVIERRQMAENFEVVCKRNGNCSHLKWLTSQCLTLAVMAIAYIAAIFIWQTFE